MYVYIDVVCLRGEYELRSWVISIYNRLARSLMVRSVDACIYIKNSREMDLYCVAIITRLNDIITHRITRY